MPVCAKQFELYLTIQFIVFDQRDAGSEAQRSGRRRFIERLMSFHSDAGGAETQARDRREMSRPVPPVLSTVMLPPIRIGEPSREVSQAQAGTAILAVTEASACWNFRTGRLLLRALSNADAGVADVETGRSRSGPGTRLPTRISCRLARVNPDGVADQVFTAVSAAAVCCIAQQQARDVRRQFDRQLQALRRLHSPEACRA
ncbi:MAG: hypothetical protein IPG52_02640 [Rhodocyclaceae bacterium]|nr:hypothetical protein [Rhodocyclaceae bacterium]